MSNCISKKENESKKKHWEAELLANKKKHAEELQEEFAVAPQPAVMSKMDLALSQDDDELSDPSNMELPVLNENQLMSQSSVKSIEGVKKDINLMEAERDKLKETVGFINVHRINHL